MAPEAVFTSLYFLLKSRRLCELLCLSLPNLSSRK